MNPVLLIGAGVFVSFIAPRLYLNSLASTPQEIAQWPREELKKVAWTAGALSFSGTALIGYGVFRYIKSA